MGLVNRSAPGIAAVVTALLLGVTACGNDAGASVRPAAAPAAVAEQPAPSALAGLVALPAGYIADPKNTTGPFTTETYLANYSAEPALDRALLLNAGFATGYRATRLSPDKKKRYVIQLFKAANPAKAKILQAGLWRQETRDHPFQVPGALSNAHAAYDAGTEKTEAIAEASFTAGNLVALLSVRQSAPLNTPITPDTALITTQVALQHTRLTSKSS
ncbi:hypothetical protein E1263_19920 [Kribbella antibiotica]|uniref:DUF3558 domain-containing protein n=1 Tax=Kribbella antibiotica TaxID=190195 RepID=A0A4R4ZKF9_9ACTN|nr:hypothetical protein [Kribbella antibiotica]TDD58284.1 hypothetical protein E1263_19920 [Kribbella antibiotica]